MVIGVSSVWSNATNLIVGQRGIGNRLSVSNGALVQSANGYVGYQTNNNAVYLTGVGSLWRNSANLYIGCFGGSFGNRLTILDGARVESSSGCIGLGREAVGFTPRYYSWGNEVVVSGAGSVWSNQNDLHVGDVGTNNLLRIWTGALVSAKSVKVGRAGGDNVVMLSDGTLAADSVIVCPAALNWLGGKGAIYGRVVNFAFADANVSGGTLTFHGMVCNRGSLRAYSGAVMEFQNAVFNLGTANFSGGGAVFHDSELTYSFACSEDSNIVPKNILESYQKICNGLILGFKEIELEAKFVPLNDIAMNGKKISGNAQTRREKVVLQHGTILLKVDVDKMFSILKVPNEKLKGKMIENVKQRVTSVEKEFGKEFSFEDCALAMKLGFQKAFNANLVNGELSKEELKLAEQIKKEQFSKKEWNFKR